MPTITAIERQKRRRRANVLLDNGEAFSLRLDVMAGSGLAAGEQLSEQRRRELQAQDQRLDAIEKALRLIAVQPRSERDLADRLRRRGFGRPAVEAATARMRELGYLDDAAFAKFYVESRQTATPRSRRALAFELGRRGVNREVADETLAEVSDADAAYDAAQRRLRALQGLDRQTFARRLGAFLASRGFGYGVARATIDRCWVISMTAEAAGHESDTSESGERSRDGPR